MPVIITSGVIGSSGPKFVPGAGADRPFFVAGVGVYNPSGNGTSPSDLPPIPVEWILAPLNSTAAQCPSHAATLRTFGITNALVAAFAIVFGCRPFVHWLTRGYLGNRGGKMIRWMWLVNLACQVLSNLFVSLLIKNSNGYGHLSLLNLFALYSARPRVSLPALAMLRIFVAVNLRKLMKKREEKYPDKTEFLYHDSFRTAAIAELCMQVFASIFVGVTWSRFPNAPVKDWMSETYKLMCAAPAFTLLGIAGYGAFNDTDGEALPQGPPSSLSLKYPQYRNIWLWRIGCALGAGFFIGFAYLWQWIYFIAFLRLPGSLWCPPHLLQQAAIWTTMSTLGMFLGASS